MLPQLLFLLLLCLHADLVPVLLQEVPAADAAQHVGEAEEAQAQCVQTDCNDDKVDKMIAVLEQQFAAQMQLLKDLVKCQCSRLSEPTLDQLLPGNTRRTGKAHSNEPSPIEGTSEVTEQGSPPSHGDEEVSSLPTTIPALAGAGPLPTAEDRAGASLPRPDLVPDSRTFQIFPDCDGDCPSIHRAYHKQRLSDPSDRLSPDPPHDLNTRTPMVESFPPSLESPGEEETVEAELAGGEEGLKPKQSTGRTSHPPPRSTASTNSPQSSPSTSKTTQHDRQGGQVTPARIVQTTTQAAGNRIFSPFSIFPKCDGDCYTFPQAYVKG